MKDQLISSPNDPNDRWYKSEPVTFSTSPIVDLVPLIDEVSGVDHDIENQGSTNSCTATAAASALEIMYGRAGNWKDFSRLYIYWYVRQYSNISGDKGAYPRHIGVALENHGACESEFMPWAKARINDEPSELAISEAQQHKIVSYERVEANIDEIRNAVLHGLPVLTTVRIRKAMTDAIERGSDWRTHDWESIVQDHKGLHEVLIVGFCDKTERFLVQNSWGPYWGDGGFYGLPYEKVGDKRRSQDAFEFWVIKDPGFDPVHFEDEEMLDASYYDPSDYNTDYEPEPEPQPTIFDFPEVKEESKTSWLPTVLGAIVLLGAFYWFGV